MATPITRVDITRSVENVLIDELCVDRPQIVADARLREDLEADSLDLVELTMALEEQFGIEIPDADAAPLVTVGDVVDYIARRLALSAAGEGVF